MPKHMNNGNCSKCEEFLEKTHPTIAKWFRDRQTEVWDVHISCSMRGQIAQEAAFQRGASRAHFGESAHNFDPSFAIDTFFMVEGKINWDSLKYMKLCGVGLQNLPREIEWYGKPRSKFKELPHFELKDWKQLVDMGEAKLTDEA